MGTRLVAQLTGGGGGEARESELLYNFVVSGQVFMYKALQSIGD